MSSSLLAILLLGLAAIVVVGLAVVVGVLAIVAVRRSKDRARVTPR
jgi:hypothetical protein